jgi:hypothetical protein
MRETVHNVMLNLGYAKIKPKRLTHVSMNSVKDLGILLPGSLTTLRRRGYMVLARFLT